MKLRRVCVLLCLAAAASFTGCAKRAPETTYSGPPLEQFYPLAVGNRWTYESNYLGEKSDRTIEIQSVDSEGFFADSAGTHLRFDAFGLRDPKRYLLRLPIETGQSWTNVVSVSSVERYQITQVGLSCTVPAGQFEGCVKVEGRNRVDQKNTVVIEWLFAPKVGLVKLDTTLESDGKRIPQISMALKSYALRNDPPAAASTASQPPSATP